MQNAIEMINPNGIEWSQSKTAPAGYWGKPTFRYDGGQLGEVELVDKTNLGELK